LAAVIELGLAAVMACGKQLRTISGSPCSWSSTPRGAPIAGLSPGNHGRRIPLWYVSYDGSVRAVVATEMLNQAGSLTGCSFFGATRFVI
jgi:hypothetical protein